MGKPPTAAFNYHIDQPDNQNPHPNMQQELERTKEAKASTATHHHTKTAGTHSAIEAPFKAIAKVTQHRHVLRTQATIKVLKRHSVWINAFIRQWKLGSPFCDRDRTGCCLLVSNWVTNKSSSRQNTH